ncbi:related to TY3B TY3B protein [Armillaria ostoyae]|uniref:Related to TY3B TY3B protein n=1 Tax=Armillaria ostoyae TaxID=47428 RepID=A0A284RZW3_ARMOS|nr:related to TY3B TY3B protein [Armillaria ostoyae]
MDKLGSAKYFTKLDVHWGYNNVCIKKDDEWKAVFRTNRRLFEPTVMFFGLTNSPATFQWMMNDIFKDLIATGKVTVYLDDILIFSKTLEEHWKITCHVLELLRKHKLFLKAEKCEFEVLETEYLGVIISEGSICMDPIKLAGIEEWPAPTKKKELQSFLGFANFYRRFIKGYSDIVRSMTHLTGKEVWTWGTAQQMVFQRLKNQFAIDVILCIPTEKGQFRVEADASEGAIGAVLSQEQDRKWRPVAFLSKALTTMERNYKIYDKELLAIMLTLDEWRHYLMGAAVDFEIWTDHQNLQYFRKPQKLNRRQARWVTELAEYHFTLHHKPGASNKKADLLSRRADHPQGQDDNNEITVLSPEHFRAMTPRKMCPAYHVYIYTKSPYQALVIAIIPCI